MPNIVQSELGLERTDKGFLGCGIYFTDSPRYIGLNSFNIAMQNGNTGSSSRT